MLKLTQDSIVNKSHQQFSIWKLDSDSEGQGFALSIMHNGNQMDVTLNKEEAFEFTNWCTRNVATFGVEVTG